MITKETFIPEFEDLKVEECNLGTPFLIAGAYHLGKTCEAINNEFMLCRKELNDPRKCITEGKAVTACTMTFFRAVKKNCAEEFTDYANCLDKSSHNYSMRYCRNTQAIFDSCMKEKLNVVRPHIGYHSEARVHESTRPKPPEPKPMFFPDAIPDLPSPDIPRPAQAKYGNRGILD